MKLYEIKKINEWDIKWRNGWTIKNVGVMQFGKWQNPDKIPQNMIFL